jgi:mercuric ion binding protein
MNGLKSSLAAFVFVGAIAGQAFADVQVELKKTHVCCGQCEKAVAKVLDAEGVKGAASKTDGTVKFTASDAKTAQKVLDSLAAAGFHGVVDNKDLTVKDDSGAKEGKVTSLTLKGVHNCCGQCNNTIKKTIKAVDGVESEDAKPNAETITIKGNFDGKALVKALNDAGFHATVEK